jgi:hypothetical protein
MEHRSNDVEGGRQNIEVMIFGGCRRNIAVMMLVDVDGT